MTDERFSELVNLYLDKEISEAGLTELKGALSANRMRAEEFRERKRLHQATRMAMQPGASRSRQRSRSGSGSSRTVRSGRRKSSTSSFPRWFVSGGLAACLTLGLAYYVVSSQEVSLTSPQSKLGVVSEPSVDLLDGVSRAELRRFAATQKGDSAHASASLASQLRLMGLRPELTPKEKKLRSVNMAALEAKRPSRSGADLLYEVQKISPIPEPRIFRAGSVLTEPRTSQWPSGFHSSLASFR